MLPESKTPNLDAEITGLTSTGALSFLRAVLVNEAAYKDIAAIESRYQETWNSNEAALLAAHAEAANDYQVNTIIAMVREHDSKIYANLLPNI